MRARDVQLHALLRRLHERVYLHPAGGTGDARVVQLKAVKITLDPRQLQLVIDGLELLLAIGIQHECEGAQELIDDIDAQALKQLAKHFKTTPSEIMDRVRTLRD